jgi:hypothetical protein
VVQALPTEGANMVDRCCCRVGSRIIQHTRTSASELLAPCRTICVDMTSGPYGCLPDTHYSVVLSLHSTTSHNTRGMLPVYTEHSDTPPVLRGPRK